MRQDIVRLTIPPGTRLRMADVAERAGVSLTPARQVLRRLEAEGLVVSYPRTGSSVAPLTFPDAELVMTVCGALERRLLSLGVPALEEHDLTEMASLLQTRSAAVASRDIDGIDETAFAIRDVVYRRAARPELFREAITWRHRQQRYVRHAVLAGIDIGSFLGHEVNAFVDACLRRDTSAAEAARMNMEDRVLDGLQASLRSS